MSTIDVSKMDKYVDGKLVKEGVKEVNASEQKYYWWKTDLENMPQQIAGTIKFIHRHQGTHLEQLTVSTRLYGHNNAFNLLGTAYTRAASVNSSPMSQRISYNLCSSVVDTLTAHVAKNKVIPTYLTEGGVWSKQKNAKDLTKFTEGCFYGSDAHRKLVDMFTDSAVWGTGILHVCRDGDNICVQRVLPHELEVDQIEAMVTDPQQLHRVKIVDRDILLDLFPDTEDRPDCQEAIKNAMPSNYEDVGGQGTAADLVTVTESWHLKSGPDAEDGFHAICVGDYVVRGEEYEKDYFPFVFFNYARRLLGFWGQGACERLQNLQGEINRLMILDQKSRWMQGSFKILSHIGDRVPTQHFNNEVGPIIKWAGEIPPSYIAPPAINPDNAVQIDALISKGYRQEGVSEMMAAAVKPLGLDSGKAIREYNSIAEDRQLFIQQNMEVAALELGRQMVEVAKEIYADKGTFKVVFPSTKFMQTIDWGDIKLKEDEYILKAYPTSSLADDFSGRLADIQEGMQAGLISPRLGKRLMSFPDVEMADHLSNAAEDLLHKLFEDMLEEGADKYRPAEPFMDLTLAKQLALEYWNYAEYMNAPQDRLDLIQDFVTSINDLLGLNAPPPPQPMPGGAAAPGASQPSGIGAPQAQPAPAPVSNLIPNVPGGQSEAA